MATHVHSTRTPLLPLSRSAPPLLGQGSRLSGISAQVEPKLARQPGPVTQAIRAMRAAEPGVSGQVAQIDARPVQVLAQVGPKRLEFPTSCRKLAQVGQLAPPSADSAIAAIRDGLAAHFIDADRQRVRELHRRIADRIEADLALLDALDPDPELEDGHDAEGGTDDNGIADYDAIGEQGFSGYGRCL